MALSEQQQRDIWEKIMGYPDIPAIAGKWPSRSMFADDSAGVDDTVGMLLNTDGNAWNILVILGALLGVPDDVAKIRRVAAGQLAPDIRANSFLATRAVSFAKALEPICGSLSGSTPAAPATPVIAVPPQTTPPPPPARRPGQPVLFTINGFMGDMWQAMPADTGRALQDVYYFQPVGYNSGAFPLGVGRDDGVRELRRLITEVYPDRPFAFASFSLGAIIAADVFDQIRFGDLKHRLPDFLGGVSWGNPRREAGNWAGGGPDPGGAGIAGPDNLKNTPPNYLSYANTGDIYTCCPTDDVGADMTLVYNMVLMKWNGSIASIMAEALELLQQPIGAAINIIMAVINGITFVQQQQAPHMNYPIDGAVAFLHNAARVTQ